MSQSGETVYHPDNIENPTPHTNHDEAILSEQNLNNYWRANRRVVATLLSIWAIVTFGFGIVLGPWLDQYQVAGFPLGFWFSQQGCLVIYVALIFIYHFWMLSIERRYGVDDDSAPPTPSADHKEAK